MRSSLQHNFAQVPSADIPRSSFDRTHCNKRPLTRVISFLFTWTRFFPAIALI